MFVYLSAFVLLPAFACFDTEKPVLPGEAVEIPAAVLYHFGKITADGAPIKTGDIASGGAIVKTERKSLGNLQLQSAEARIVFLMRENAELRLVAVRRGKVTDVTPILVHGRVLVQVEKLSSSERLFVYTPEAHIAVQGTELIVSSDVAGNTNIQVHSGVVRVRPRLALLEDLPPAVLERSVAARRVMETLDGLGTNVEAGQQTQVSQANSDHVLVLVPGLKQQLVAASSETRAGDAAGRSSTELAELLDRRLDRSANMLAARIEMSPAHVSKSGIEPVEITSLKQTNVSLTERESMRKDFRAIISVDPEIVNDPERLPAAIPVTTEELPYQEVQGTEDDAVPVASTGSTNTAPVQSQEDQLKALAKKMRGSVKVLVLQNGEEKRGVVVNQGEDYLFATTAGQKVYKRDEVREVRLR